MIGSGLATVIIRISVRVRVRIRARVRVRIGARVRVNDSNGETRHGPHRNCYPDCDLKPMRTPAHE